MDDAGYRARRRADKEAYLARRDHLPGLEEPAPLPEEEVDPRQEADEDVDSPNATTPQPPPPPPPDSSSHIPQPSEPDHGGGQNQDDTTHIPQMPSDAPGHPSGIRHIDPPLRVMCGPMLRYDTVSMETGAPIWHGFCMLVTADSGSVYAPVPTLSLRWRDPFKGKQSYQIKGEMIQVFRGTTGAHSFWRFKLEIGLSDKETPVKYSINGGHEIAFYVPARNQNMRWVGHSCNGFSSGVRTELFNGPDPLWNDVLEKHKETPYHVAVGGGDQIYCDAIAREPELNEWLADKDPHRKAKAVLTPEMSVAIDRFMFNHYCTWFRSGAFGKVISCIPMLNMLDDHDLIDGFGSYPDELQTSPVFSAIGSRGYFWFLLFQCFIVDEVDGSIPNNPHSNRSIIIGGPGAYIPHPSHSFLTYLGPNVFILMLDCRAERKKDRICSTITYERVFNAMTQLPPQVQHIVILVGVPILYPRMVFAERFLDGGAKRFFFLFPRMTNKFNNEAELKDDMADHWCAADHKNERNWLVVKCQNLARDKKMRVTFLSGDVHCAAVGRVFHRSGQTPPEKDYRFILNVISSAIVNTPPPAPLIALIGKLSQKEHKTLHAADTDEDCVDLFTEDTDGTKLSNSRFMPRRNYASVMFNEKTGELEFDIRVEITKGGGTTKGYSVSAPAVRF